jgi:hypothetical protein
MFKINKTDLGIELSEFQLSPEVYRANRGKFVKKEASPEELRKEIRVIEKYLSSAGGSALQNLAEATKSLSILPLKLRRIVLKSTDPAEELRRLFERSSA